MSTLSQIRELENRPRPTLRKRLLRVLLIALLALAIVAGIHTWQSTQETHGSAHAAMKLVDVVSAEEKPDGVHITARLDAPSPQATSHRITGVIPTATWRQTHVLWACYPPADPAKAVLRTPLDPACSNLPELQN